MAGIMEWWNGGMMGKRKVKAKVKVRFEKFSTST
jgi:hypothetical protein